MASVEPCCERFFTLRLFKNCLDIAKLRGPDFYRGQAAGGSKPDHLLFGVEADFLSNMVLLCHFGVKVRVALRNLFCSVWITVCQFAVQAGS